MCRLENIAMRDYQESVTTGQTDRWTDTGQSDPYVPLCFAGDTKSCLLEPSCHCRKASDQTDFGQDLHLISSFDIMKLIHSSYVAEKSSDLPELTPLQLTKLRHLTLVSLATKNKVMNMNKNCCI